MLGRSDVWWTLGFEAFGDLDTVAINLTRVVLPEMSILAGTVSSGALLSYPGWLSARLTDWTLGLAWQWDQTLALRQSFSPCSISAAVVG